MKHVSSPLLDKKNMGNILLIRVELRGKLVLEIKLNCHCWKQLFRTL